jgi:hypothetical protein
MKSSNANDGCDENTIKYFKALALQNGIPYQDLINLYLRECAKSKKKLTIAWEIGVQSPL